MTELKALERVLKQEYKDYRDALAEETKTHKIAVKAIKADIVRAKKAKK